MVFPTKHDQASLEQNTSMGIQSRIRVWGFGYNQIGAAEGAQLFEALLHNFLLAQITFVT